MSLYGVYGSHTPETCPVNNRKIAEALVEFAKTDLASVAGKYKINHIASFNYLKIVPLITFSEGVIPHIKEIHGL
jgi:hypothetical protein